MICMPGGYFACRVGSPCSQLLRTDLIYWGTALQFERICLEDAPYAQYNSW